MSSPDQALSNRLILEAGRADRQYWRDLWRYRELFFILAWRDVAVRYKQTVVGFAWAFVRPFMTMSCLPWSSGISRDYRAAMSRPMQ